MLQEKQIIFHTGKKVHHLRLSTFIQSVLMLIFLAFLYWVVQTSMVYFFGNDMLFSKEKKLAKQLYKNEVLSSDLEYYKSRVGGAEGLAVQIQETQSELLDKMDLLLSDELKKTDDNFKSIQKSLKESGVSWPRLKNKMAQTQNMGGPYVPLPESGLLSPVFAQKLSSINQKVQELETIVTLEVLLPLSSPIRVDYRVSSAFGGRPDPFTKAGARHEGMDLVAQMGASIYATAPGKVKRAFNNGAYGNFVEIEHALGFVTRYAHLDKILVKVGDAVITGDKVGLLGDTGRSTGAHLHYEILSMGRVINPYRFIKTSRMRRDS